MTKLSRDPTQSQWIEDKYNKDVQKAFTQYYAELVDIATGPGTIEEIKTKIDEHKTKYLNDVFRPVASKYVTMALKQGVKYSRLNVKRRRL